MIKFSNYNKIQRIIKKQKKDFIKKKNFIKKSQTNKIKDLQKILKKKIKYINWKLKITKLYYW